MPSAVGGGESVSSSDSELSDTTRFSWLTVDIFLGCCLKERKACLSTGSRWPIFSLLPNYINKSQRSGGTHFLKLSRDLHVGCGGDGCYKTI